MTNPNTDTVEAVARAIVAGRNLPDGCDINWETFRLDARNAIAAMPGSGEAMREAAATKAEDYGDRNCPADYAKGDGLVSGYAKQQAAGEIADEIRALPLPQGGGSALAAAVEEWRSARQAIFDVPTPYKDKAASKAAGQDVWIVPPTYMAPLFALLGLAEHRLMLAASPLPPAQEG